MPPAHFTCPKGKLLHQKEEIDSKPDARCIQGRDAGAAVGAGPLDGPCEEIVIQNSDGRIRIVFVRIRPSLQILYALTLPGRRGRRPLQSYWTLRHRFRLPTILRQRLFYGVRKDGFAFLTDGVELLRNVVKSFALRQKMKSKVFAFGEIEC